MPHAGRVHLSQVQEWNVYMSATSAAHEVQRLLLEDV